MSFSPITLVIGENDFGDQMRQIFAAAGQAMPETKPILEINQAHPLVSRLDSESDEELAATLAGLLYDQAALAAGKTLDNPAHFVREINRFMFS